MFEYFFLTSFGIRLQQWATNPSQEFAHMHSNESNTTQKKTDLCGSREYIWSGKLIATGCFLPYIYVIVLIALYLISRRSVSAAKDFSRYGKDIKIVLTVVLTQTDVIHDGAGNLRL